jgi:hypothetical protein
MSGEFPQDITGCVQSMDCNGSGEFLIFTIVRRETTSTEAPPPHRFMQAEVQTLGFSEVPSLSALIRWIRPCAPQARHPGPWQTLMTFVDLID